MSDDSRSPAAPAWALPPAAAAERCVRFLAERLATAGRDRFVVGLSGGIDSAVATALAVRAVGAERVLALTMPYATSAPTSLADASAVAARLGVRTEHVEITPLADPFLSAVPAADRVRRGNIMARCRMIVLYDRSARDGALVLGTGNRTEALLGYTTMYGDNACALNPIGQLYKTEVRLLAAWLGLPPAVLVKAPSADLWGGQADEDELGFSYEQADAILHHLVDEGLGLRQIQALGFGPALVARVRDRMAAMAFKRQLPPVAEMPGRRDPETVAAARPASAAFTDGGFH